MTTWNTFTTYLVAVKFLHVCTFPSLRATVTSIVITAFVVVVVATVAIALVINGSAGRGWFTLVVRVNALALHNDKLDWYNKLLPCVWAIRSYNFMIEEITHIQVSARWIYNGCGTLLQRTSLSKVFALFRLSRFEGTSSRRHRNHILCCCRRRHSGESLAWYDHSAHSVPKFVKVSICMSPIDDQN